MDEAIKVFVILMGVGLAGGLVYGMIAGIHLLYYRLTGTQLWSGGGEDFDILTDRVAQLEAELTTQADYDNVMARLAEQDERIDFAERLLAQGEPVELPEPTDEVSTQS